jgi:hypothetical protein
MSNLLNRKPRRVQPEVFAGTKAAIARATGGLREGGLRLSADRVDDEEQRELVGLVERACEGGGFNANRLDEKQRRRFEALCEKGCGATPGSIFERAREMGKLKRDLDHVVREARTPPRRLKLEEPGSITLRRQWVFDFVRDGILFPAHIACLVYVQTIFEGGAIPKPAPGLSYDGETITIDTGKTAIPPDPTGAFMDWKKLVEHLAKNGFINLEITGRQWHVQRGVRLKAPRGTS